VKPKYLELELHALLENLNEILTIVKTVVSYDEELNLQFFEKLEEDQELEDRLAKQFYQLSSGTKSFCALIIDLLLTLKEQQPDVSDPAKYKGIVIVDEIDLHLHPSMQKEIVFQLSETFPLIQFILSTHSPMSMLGAPKNSLFYRVTRSADEGIRTELLDIDVTNLNPNLILTSPIFGFSELLSANHSGSLNTQDYWFEKKTDDSKLNSLLEKYKERKNRLGDDQQKE
jgi:hypothetical protein